MKRKNWLLHPAFCLVLLATPLAQAAAPGILVLEPKVRWAKSASCQDYPPSHAASMTDTLEVRLAEQGHLRILSREQQRTMVQDLRDKGAGDVPQGAIVQMAQAKFLLASEWVCHPTSLDFLISLIDPATGEIAWAKSFELAGPSEAPAAILKAAQLLDRIVGLGQSPAAAEQDLEPSQGPLNRRSMALDLQALPRLMTEEELAALRQSIRERLVHEQGARLQPALVTRDQMQRCLASHLEKIDRHGACLVRVAGAEGLELALQVEVVKLENGCALSWRLHQLEPQRILADSHLESGCGLEALREAGRNMAGRLGKGPADSSNRSSEP